MATIALASKLLARRELAERTFAFEFEKPAGFQFAAGQTLDLRLPDLREKDPEGDKRTFSIASAPSSPRLEIATRLRGTPFKKALRERPIGSPLELEGPFGSLTLHKKAERTAVIVAGGIGITPFMSMLRQAASERSTRSFVLITCNRRPEDAPFLDELELLVLRLPGLRLLATMTQAERAAKPWTGRRGRVTPELIKETAPELKNAVCYAAGPPALVAAMRQAFLAAGADEDSLRTEEFQGY